jgi:hypothetical protein
LENQVELMAKQVEKTLLARTTESRERELERGRDRMRELRSAYVTRRRHRGIAMSDGPSFKFCLYVAGDTQNSAQAMANLRALCRAHLLDQHEIEVIDVFSRPRARAGRRPGQAARIRGLDEKSRFVQGHIGASLHRCR